MKKFLLITLLSLGVDIKVWATPQRIISLAPAITETLYILGLENKIVGVTAYCNYPPQAKDKTKIGDFANPNLEKVISLKPDLILASDGVQVGIVERLRTLNLRVEVIAPRSIEEILDSFISIGQLTGKEEAALKSVENIRMKLKYIQNKLSVFPAEKRPKVFLELWHQPLITIGKGSFVNEFISYAGGINITGQIKAVYPLISSEYVLKESPDIIIVGHTMKKEENVSAFRQGRVYTDIDPDLLLRPGPRFIQGIEQLHKIFYPDTKE